MILSFIRRTIFSMGFLALLIAMFTLGFFAVFLFLFVTSSKASAESFAIKAPIEISAAHPSSSPFVKSKFASSRIGGPERAYGGVDYKNSKLQIFNGDETISFDAHVPNDPLSEHSLPLKKDHEFFDPYIRIH